MKTDAIPLPKGFDAGVWPFDVPDPVMVMGICFLPNALIDGSEDWTTAFSAYARFYGLNACTGNGPLRIIVSLDGEVCIDEDLDLLVGNRVYCLRHPVILHRHSIVECEFSHSELVELLTPVLVYRTIFEVLETIAETRDS